MALVTPKCIFFHIERTGGNWVRKALREAGISCSVELGPRHSTPAIVNSKDRFRFAFVRHPLRWYESYFRGHLPLGNRHGKSPVNDFERTCVNNNFGLFLQNANYHFRSYVTSLYKLSTEIDTSRELNFIGRQESLKQDLIEALTQAGEDFDKDKIIELDEIDVSPGVELKWPAKLYEKIVQAEGFVFERFNYDDKEVLLD